MKTNNSYRVFLICPVEDHAVLCNELYQNSTENKLPLLPNINFPGRGFDEIRYLPGGEFISATLKGESNRKFETAFGFCGVPDRSAAYFNIESLSYKRNAFVRILDDKERILVDLLFGERQSMVRELNDIMRFFLTYPDRYEIIREGKSLCSGYLFPSTDISLSIPIYDLHDGDRIKTTINHEINACFTVKSGKLVLIS